MGEYSRDPDADLLMEGSVLPGDPELGRLVRFVDDVREAYGATPDAATRTRHLSAMAEAYVARSSTQVLGGPSTNGHLPATRRRPRLLVRAGIAAAVLVVVGGSALAATGGLPRPAQNALARVARFVGVDLPRADRPTVIRSDRDRGRRAKRPAVISKRDDGRDRSDDRCSVDDPCSLDREADDDATSVTSAGKPKGSKTNRAPAPTPEPNADDPSDDNGSISGDRGDPVATAEPADPGDGGGSTDDPRGDGGGAEPSAEPGGDRGDPTAGADSSAEPEPGPSNSP